MHRSGFVATVTTRMLVPVVTHAQQRSCATIEHRRNSILQHWDAIHQISSNGNCRAKDRLAGCGALSRPSFGLCSPL